jgi:hypothetical protein
MIVEGLGCTESLIAEGAKVGWPIMSESVCLEARLSGERPATNITLVEIHSIVEFFVVSPTPWCEKSFITKKAWVDGPAKRLNLSYRRLTNRPISL